MGNVLLSVSSNTATENKSGEEVVYGIQVVGSEDVGCQQLRGQ